MKIDTGSKKGVLVVPVFNDKDKIHFFNDKDKEKIKSELKSFQYEGKKEEGLFLKIGEQKILLIGVNKECSLEDVRRSYSIVFNVLKARKEKIATIEVPKEDEKTIKAVVEGMDLTDYKFDKYQKKKEEKDIEIEVFLNVNSKYNALIKETISVNQKVKFVRDLVNENSNIVTPVKIASIASEFAKKHNLKHEILDEKRIQKEGLNLLWEVGRGSHFPPRLIVVEYNGDSKSKEKLALVGKGITFDIGGSNLKPSGYLEDMKIDMTGAATCMATFMAAVELKLKKNLVLVIPTAENALSGHSYKPGDFVVSYSGMGVEITNTDAEGRLILADAMSYVQKNYKVTAIIDMATLTGACMVALGYITAGMMGNDEKMKKSLFNAGEETHERVWELPIYEEHRDAMKSKLADIKNSEGKSYGGASNAAAFLEKFIEKDVKWVHLDVAGPAKGQKDSYYVPEWGTGKYVRMLVEFLK